MKVLVIGSGGREHALCWKLADSPLVTDLYCAPGNPGTAQFADNVDLSVMDFDGIEAFAKAKGVELVVIGPEDPLAGGLADRLRAAGLRVFGPDKDAAQLEGDKWFAKELMRQQSIPTAEARSFTDPVAAEEWIKVRDEPVVIKATGLAKGKGVTVCYRTSDALDAIDRIMRKKEFGEAGSRIVIEEKLSGPECSILAFVSGRAIYPLEPAQDHKTIDEGDTGPMTGGMGAYSPTPIVTPKLLKDIEQTVLIPIVDGLMRDGIDYRGVLYAGLMLTPAGPRVLEFNCRFGDPETQPLMMRMKGDLAEVMVAVADNTLFKMKAFKWDPRPAITVVATSKGYPGKYPTGLPITGVEKADALPDVKVFHSGTAMKDGQLVTAGGRVLSVTAIGKTLQEAHAKAYEALNLIHFDGMHYRKDIGYQALHQGARVSQHDLQPISDINDPRLAVYHNVKDRELAAEGDLFIAQGFLVVQRLLRSAYPCVSVLCAERKLDLIRADLRPGVPVYLVPDGMIHEIIGFEFHTGLMAVGRRPPLAPLEATIPQKDPLTLLVLPETNNVQNLGAIARIAAAFGVDAMVLGERCADPFYRQALRVSMGTFFTLPLHRSADLKGDLKRLTTEWGVELAATVLDPSAEPLAMATRPARLAILLGGEFDGLSSEYVALCQRRVTIPMAPAIDSLNVSIASAVFLYHFTQLQPGTPPPSGP